jgi:hypothetical protein
MAARPPQDSSPEPDTIAFGIAALDARLDRAEFSFPADAETIVAAVTDTDIPYDAAGSSLSLAEAIDRTGTTRFETERQLLNELYPVFEAERQSRSSGVLGQLRSLLPF